MIKITYKKIGMRKLIVKLLSVGLFASLPQ